MVQTAPAATPRLLPARLVAPAVGLLTFVIYAVASLGKSTGWNAHSRLAWAMLHGSFSLSPPYGTWELITDAAGHHFIAYGPTASFLLLPFVWLFGAATNQTLVSCLFGAVAVAFWWAYLEQAGTTLSARSWLTILCAGGTSFFFYAAQDGGNWGIPYTVAILGLMVALWAGSVRRPLLAGLATGAAIMSRNPELFLVPAIAMQLLAPDAESWREVRIDWPKLVRFAVGLAILGAILAYYNWARFGSVFDNGYQRLWLTDPLGDFGRRPLFSLAYAAHEIPFYLTAPPIWLGRFPWLGAGQAGLSMLLVTPVLWLLPFVNYRKPANLVALACALAVQALYFVFAGDGRNQFGMRYTLDYLVMVLLLVTSLTRERFGLGPRVLTVLGILVEIWGFVSWHAMGW